MFYTPCEQPRSKKRARDDDQTGCKQDKRLAKFTWWTVKLPSSACPRLNALGMRVVHHTHGQWVCSLLTFQMHILYFKDYQYIICFMQFLYLHCSPKPLKALTKRAECENANQSNCPSNVFFLPASSYKVPYAQKTAEVNVCSSCVPHPEHLNMEDQSISRHEAVW